MARRGAALALLFVFVLLRLLSARCAARRSAWRRIEVILRLLRVRPQKAASLLPLRCVEQRARVIGAALSCARAES